MSKTGDWVIRDQERRAQELLDQDLVQRGEPTEDRPAACQLLLTYAECQEAWERFASSKPRSAELAMKLDDVENLFRRHGWDDQIEPDVQEFLASLRRAALAAGRNDQPEGS